jgi:ribosomal protein L16 Arg81 hydroxylase
MGGAFASWGDMTGFDLHWDAMDNVAVQVAGTRRWSLWRPAIANPVEGVDMPRPEGPADLDCVLHPGDALWFPRGWWHRPAGLGEPALHVTFGIYRRTGIDLVRWLCESLCLSGGGAGSAELDLTQPWSEDVIDSFWAAERTRGLENRLTFTLPDVS